ncbi:MAG: Crp/Fnr family transcriptional regulator [Deltaproteobacteria bacterium]|nr:Crp/Fnr family transcriptional regulator [Deltaproteobacteria bacterium]
MLKTNHQRYLNNLDRYPLFSKLSRDALDLVKKKARHLRLSPHEILFSSGTEAASFFLVVQGSVKLSRLSSDGDEKVIEIIPPGALFAEAVAFFNPPVYPVDAQAIARTELLAFDNKTFLDILKKSNETCLTLIGSLCHRLHERLMEIDSLTLQNATYRLVNYLLGQAKGSIDQKQIRLSAPKKVIASQLSIKPETLSRILTQLGHEGLIKVRQQNIVLLSIEGLNALLA